MPFNGTSRSALFSSLLFLLVLNVSLSSTIAASRAHAFIYYTERFTPQCTVQPIYKQVPLTTPFWTLFLSQFTFLIFPFRILSFSIFFIIITFFFLFRISFSMDIQIHCYSSHDDRRQSISIPFICWVISVWLLDLFHVYVCVCKRAILFVCVRIFLSVCLYALFKRGDRA